MYELNNSLRENMSLSKIVQKFFSGASVIKQIFEVSFNVKSLHCHPPHMHTAAKSLQSCPTLCDPIDSSPPGSPVPGILQSRTLEWTSRLLPCPGYYKQCCDKHLGTRVSFNSGFLGVYVQQWDCWVTRQFYFQFFKESPHCSP